MGKVKREEIVNTARKIGRRDAIKKRSDICRVDVHVEQRLTMKCRDMIAGSKRRKHKQGDDSLMMDREQ
jgi:hypothetical protein